MIVNANEYNSALASIKDPNEYLPLIRIPSNEPIYKIDLNTRSIEAPSYVGAYNDHNAEIIWFQVDRFYDNIDLYGNRNPHNGNDSLKRTGNCWIQYRNAKKEDFYYAAPMIITSDESAEEKILIPWVISQDVAKKSGTIEFSFQFFALSEGEDKDENAVRHFRYIINTRSAKTKVLDSLDIEVGVLEEEPVASTLQRLEDAVARLSADYNLYWIDVN